MRLLKQTLYVLVALIVSPLASSADATDPGIGFNPPLPAPSKSLLPTVHIAKAVGWPSNRAPTAAAGLAVAAYATGLNHPRWIYVLPNGDVLVAETNSPERPDDSPGIKGAIMESVMKRAGATVPSANRITLLRGLSAQGQAQTRTVFLQNLNSPFGMALVGEDFYVANTDALLRFHYAAGATQIDAAGVKLASLPGGTINHHWTKNVIASSDGNKLYVSVGSNSNVAENGIAAEDQRAAILEVDAKSGAQTVFASGLRNPVGLAWRPVQNGAAELWTTVNERDELGDNLVPDYMTSVKQGGFYGWPYSYYGQHVDDRVKPQRPDLVASAIIPDYALGSHTASLGLTFYSGSTLPAHFNGGAFIGQHGSWNRNPRSGYKVVFVSFENGKPTGRPQDVLTGFISDGGDAYGRPVGVAIDKQGALLVADDVGNTIWRVTAAKP